MADQTSIASVMDLVATMASVTGGGVGGGTAPTQRQIFEAAVQRIHVGLGARRDTMGALVLSSNPLTRAIIVTQLRGLGWSPVHDAPRLVDGAAYLHRHLRAIAAATQRKAKGGGGVAASPATNTTTAPPKTEDSNTNDDAFYVQKDYYSVVIVDALVHETPAEIASQLRRLEARVGGTLVMILLTEPRPSDGLGLRQWPEIVPTPAQAYEWGYDLAIGRAFDHRGARFLTEMFISAGGRWQRTAAAQLAITGTSNFHAIRHILGEVTDRAESLQTNAAPSPNAASSPDMKHRNVTMPAATSTTAAAAPPATFRDPDCIDTHPDFVAVLARYEATLKSLRSLQQKHGLLRTCYDEVNAAFDVSKGQLAAAEARLKRVTTELHDVQECETTAELEVLRSGRVHDQKHIATLTAQVNYLRQEIASTTAGLNTVRVIEKEERTRLHEVEESLAEERTRRERAELALIDLQRELAALRHEAQQSDVTGAILRARLEVLANARGSQAGALGNDPDADAPRRRRGSLLFKPKSVTDKRAFVPTGSAPDGRRHTHDEDTFRVLNARLRRAVARLRIAEASSRHLNGLVMEAVDGDAGEEDALLAITSTINAHLARSPGSEAALSPAAGRASRGHGATSPTAGPRESVFGASVRSVTSPRLYVAGDKQDRGTMTALTLLGADGGTVQALEESSRGPHKANPLTPQRPNGGGVDGPPTSGRTGTRSPRRGGGDPNESAAGAPGGGQPTLSAPSDEAVVGLWRAAQECVRTGGADEEEALRRFKALLAARPAVPAHNRAGPQPLPRNASSSSLRVGGSRGRFAEASTEDTSWASTVLRSMAQALVGDGTTTDNGNNDGNNGPLMDFSVPSRDGGRRSPSHASSTASTALRPELTRITFGSDHVTEGVAGGGRSLGVGSDRRAEARPSFLGPPDVTDPNALFGGLTPHALPAATPARLRHNNNSNNPSPKRR